MRTEYVGFQSDDEMSLKDFVEMYDLVTVITKNSSKNYCVCFKDCSILKDRTIYSDIRGSGKTIQETLEDYLNKISGFTLVKNYGFSSNNIKVPSKWFEVKLY